MVSRSFSSKSFMVRISAQHGAGYYVVDRKVLE